RPAAARVATARTGHAAIVSAGHAAVMSNPGAARARGSVRGRRLGPAVVGTRTAGSRPVLVIVVIVVPAIAILCAKARGEGEGHGGGEEEDSGPGKARRDHLVQLLRRGAALDRKRRASTHPRDRAAGAVTCATSCARAVRGRHARRGARRVIKAARGAAVL